MRGFLLPPDRTGKRVLSYAQRQRQDASVTAEVLEAVVASLSSLKQRHSRLFEQIDNLDVYVFWAAAPRLNKLAAKEPALKYVGTLDDLSSLPGARDSAGALQLEKEVLLKQILGFMSARTRYLFSLREMGYSWPEIAASLGTSALSARVQFSFGVAETRRRILGGIHAKSDSSPGPGRPAYCSNPCLTNRSPRKKSADCWKVAGASCWAEDTRIPKGWVVLHRRC